MRLEISVAGDTQIDRELVRLGGRAVEAQPAFRAIASQLMDASERQFESEGAYGGERWPPLAASTLAAKLSPRMLVETGRLVESLTRRGAPDQVLEIGSDFMVFGTGVPYAELHQKGTSRMPRRRVLQLREQDKRTAVKTLQSWVLTGELTGAGSAFDALSAELG